MDHIAQAHRIGEPTHGLLEITPALSISCLVFMGLSEKCKPAETAGLHNRQI